jgi:hypothetical protein
VGPRHRRPHDLAFDRNGRQHHLRRARLRQYRLQYNPPASFRDDLQFPFVGIYGAATHGGFFVDGQVRWEFYQNQVSDSNNGLLGQHFDARGIGLTGNIGYNQDLGNDWFIEPSGGIIWSRTEVDAMNVPGTIVAGSGFVPPWVLTVNDIQSTLGRLGVRVGTSFRQGASAAGCIGQRVSRIPRRSHREPDDKFRVDRLAVSDA